MKRFALRLSNIKNEIIIYKGIDEDDTTLLLYDFIKNILSEGDVHNLILPGGKSPIKLYLKLASSEALKWQNINLILSDERLVGNGDHRTNKWQLNKYFYAHMKNIESKPKLIDIGDEGTILTLIPTLTVLGIGTDGHTASLFPNQPSIFKTNNKVSTLLTKRNDEVFFRRTLSFDYIMKSKMLVFILYGFEKREIIKEILFSDYQPLNYPVQFLLKNYKNDIYFFGDEKALNNIEYCNN